MPYEGEMPAHIEAQSRFLEVAEIEVVRSCQLFTKVENAAIDFQHLLLMLGKGSEGIDMALVVDEDVTHQEIMNIIAKYSLIKKATLFDCYTGEQIQKGKKSLAYSLVFQSNEGTLKDAKVDGVMKALTKELADDLGAVIRGA